MKKQKDLLLPDPDKKVFAPRCYESHPELSLGGGTLLGASCLNPKEGFDVYVGLDGGMKFLKPRYPWLDLSTGPTEVLFRIPDGSAPGDEGNFIAMIDWLTKQLSDGKKVHVGCIGGHGRTGIVLSALVAKILGEKDAIGWVRANYCQKAVESNVQVKFLMKYYEVDEAKPSKLPIPIQNRGVGANRRYSELSGSFDFDWDDADLPAEAWHRRTPVTTPRPKAQEKNLRTSFRPSATSIWGNT